MNINFRPKGNEEYECSMLPTIAPPPVQQAAFADSSPRFNPFDNQTEITNEVVNNEIPYGMYYMTRNDTFLISHYIERRCFQ